MLTNGVPIALALKVRATVAPDGLRAGRCLPPVPIHTVAIRPLSCMFTSAIPSLPLDPSFVPLLHSSADRLFQFLDHFTQPCVLVVGDLTLDEFMTCQVERISREAPVLIVRHESTRQVPGGGANAVYNMAKLGAKVKVAGFIGEDSQGLALRSLFEAAGIDTTGLIAERDRPTVTKTRITGHARQSIEQQIVRVDRKADTLPHPADVERLATYIREQVSQVDAIACSDYGDGSFTPETIAAALTGHPVVVDAQVDLPRYQGATWFTPNLPEAEKAVGYAIRDLESLLQAGQDLLQKTAAAFMLITRGDEGMSLFTADGEHHPIPAFNRAEVYDVTGAGDTVVAALTLGLALGATPWEAAVLGNLAASLVVRQMGTATTSPGEMRQALRSMLDSNPV